MWSVLAPIRTLLGGRRAGVVLSRLWRAADQARVARYYRQADVVVSTPGGFLNDGYDLTDRLRGFELAAQLGKPLALFGQSIGPFSNPDTRAAVGRALESAALICVRDEISRLHVTRCGIADERLARTADVAFLWRRLVPGVYVPKRGPVRRVGLCLRRWPARDKTDFKITVRKMRHVVESLSERGVQEFLFVSTCQGVPGYLDDSDLAMRVVAGLDPALRAACVVDRVRRSPEGLIRLLSACDVFIGMRLHACVLAMIGGTPAVGLAYERKTPEIFRQLGLEQYQVPFGRPFGAWWHCIERFLERVDEIREVLPGRLDSMCQEAERGLDRLDELIAATAGGDPI
jgi:colanic acid/amylovoran biosynthesis protein